MKDWDASNDQQADRGIRIEFVLLLGAYLLTLCGTVAWLVS